MSSTEQAVASLDDSKRVLSDDEKLRRQIHAFQGHVAVFNEEKIDTSNIIDVFQALKQVFDANEEMTPKFNSVLQNMLQQAEHSEYASTCP